MCAGGIAGEILATGKVMRYNSSPETVDRQRLSMFTHEPLEAFGETARQI